MPPMRPVTKALPHSMVPQPAVMETKPARMPLHKPPTSYLGWTKTIGQSQSGYLSEKHRKNPAQRFFAENAFKSKKVNFNQSHFLVMKYRKPKTTMPPVAAEMVVFMATCAANAPFSPVFMLRVLPGLKPYQPNHRAKVPSLAKFQIPIPFLPPKRYIELYVIRIWYDIYDISNMKYDVWYVICDMWYVIYDIYGMCYMIYDIWYMIYDIWYMIWLFTYNEHWFKIEI